MNPEKIFEEECVANAAKQGGDESLVDKAREFMVSSAKHKYTYNFRWLGRPIVQFPQDIVALQEIIWSTRPDLIIETGVAHGGSLILSASLLSLIGNDGRVLGIDIDVRPHNRAAIENHPLENYITLIEGSSVSQDVINRVGIEVADAESVMVILDSNHTHEHVAAELAAYSRFVKKGGYLVVFDTSIEDAPDALFENAPWGKGNNPKTAVWEFLEGNKRFEIDRGIQDKLLITVAPDGYLRCIGD